MPALPPAAAHRIVNFSLPPSIASLVLWPFAAHGTIVTTITDEDDGSLGGGTGISLREAANYSTAGDTITFHAALSGQTIRLTRGPIQIDRALIIDASALPARITLSGDKTGNGRTSDDSSIFQISVEIVDQIVSLDSLIISGAAPGSDEGGAIYSIGHSGLTVDRCTFSGNHCVSDGGAIHFYGFSPETKLTVRNSTFSEIYRFDGTGDTAAPGIGFVRVTNSVKVTDENPPSGSAFYRFEAVYDP